MSPCFFINCSIKFKGIFSYFLHASHALHIFLALINVVAFTAFAFALVHSHLFLALRLSLWVLYWFCHYLLKDTMHIAIHNTDKWSSCNCNMVDIYVDLFIHKYGVFSFLVVSFALYINWYFLYTSSPKIFMLCDFDMSPLFASPKYIQSITLYDHPIMCKSLDVLA